MTGTQPALGRFCSSRQSLRCIALPRRDGPGTRNRRGWWALSMRPKRGMRGFPESCSVSALKSAHWAADVIYTPVDTEFIKAALLKVAAS